MPKTRKMLNDWDAPYIQSLRRLIETQSKETLANWAITYCEERLLPLWERDYPDDLRPQQALKAAREWLSGTIKLPQAKRKSSPAMARPVTQREIRWRKRRPGPSVNRHRPFIPPGIVSVWLFMGPWQSPMISSGQRQAGMKLNNVPPQSAVVSKLRCVAWQWSMKRTRQKSTGTAKSDIV